MSAACDQPQSRPSAECHNLIRFFPSGIGGFRPERTVPPLRRLMRWIGSGMRGGWVYIMTNRPNGRLYVGVTADIGRRAYEHRESLVEGFTRRYGLKRLVWKEFHEDIRSAISARAT